MAIDRLQEKIRKYKNPTVVSFNTVSEQIPPYIMETAGGEKTAYKQFCKELLTGLKEIVPGVRFSFNSFAIRGWLDMLEDLLAFAKTQGYYVILDAPEALSQQGRLSSPAVRPANRAVFCRMGKV